MAARLAGRAIACGRRRSRHVWIEEPVVAREGRPNRLAQRAECRRRDAVEHVGREAEVGRSPPRMTGVGACGETPFRWNTLCVIRAEAPDRTANAAPGLS